MNWLRLLRPIAWLSGVLLTGGVVGALALVLYLEPNLPSTEALKDIRLQVPLRVYSREGLLIAEFGEKRRTPVAYADLPKRMVQAILAAEDDRFFVHPGVDYQGLLRAAAQLLRTGERRQGGSTITMQVARNFFLTREKTFARKINEILLALKIERELSKEEILELYLNKIFMGHRAYGVGAAAQVYYGTSLDQLNLAQIAMIAGLPKAPSRFNPVTNPQRAVQRRNYVLRRMHELGFIDETGFADASSAPVTAREYLSVGEFDAPYPAEMVRAEMIERFGDEAYTGGYRVYTTISADLQRFANAALRRAIHEYDFRHGYRGPEKRIAAQLDEAGRDELLASMPRVGELRPALVMEVADKSAKVYLGQGETMDIGWEGLRWARPYIDENRLGASPKRAADVLAPGDVVRVLRLPTEEGEDWKLAQIAAVEGALVSLNPDDGAILALVGGYDFSQSKFNRATQAKRQPGSGFKPFIYSAALDAGFTPATLVNDAPVVFNDAGLEAAWRPENYSGRFHGPTRLRLALANSRNLVSIRVLRSIGIQRALDRAAAFGFDAAQLPRNLSLALGSGALSPLELSRGYAALANGGYRVTPYLIDRIDDERGCVVDFTTPLRACAECDQADAGPPPPGDEEEAFWIDQERQQTAGTPRWIPAPRAISAQNHYLINSMLRDVVRIGTARKALSLGRSDLAGKTGTTNDQKDAWFSGFNRDLVAVTWVGFDSSKPLGRGETGGHAALPMWMAYMQQALKGQPERPLEMPDGITTARIDPESGLRAHPGQANAIFEVFNANNVPAELAPPGESTPESAETPASTSPDALF